MTVPLRLALIFIVIFSPFYGDAAEFIPGLVLNYSDFSYVSSIAVGYTYVYFGTTDGVIKYNITSKQWEDPMTGIEGLIARPVEKIQASFDDERVWISTDRGVYEYSETFKRWTQADSIPPSDSRARHMQPDPFFFAPVGYNYMPNGVLVDDIGRRFPLTDIVNDNWTNLWIGTWGLGPAHADNDNRLIELLNFGLIQKDITSLSFIDGFLWMGGLGGNSYRTGMTIFDRSRNSFEYIELVDGVSKRATNINEIFGRGSDTIFVASDNGVWLLDRRTKELRSRLTGRSGLPDDRVLSVFAYGDTLFVGTDYGLGIMNLHPDSSRSPQLLLPELSILCLEMAGDNLWIGTNHGIYRLNLKNWKLGRLSVPQITQTRRIFEISNSGDKMWLATDNELASIDLKTADIQSFLEVSNFGGVRAVAVKDTIIAAATTSGLLLIYNGASSYHRLFTEKDGLISTGIRDLVFEGDYLWIGTDQGLTRFWYKNPAL